MKKLSIITICYNEPNLNNTCESIVNQTWQDFEWIVIDGGSNDETQKIWDKYKYRIDKFVSEPDNGIYNAMNKGIKLANGAYLNFLNAGDAYCDNNTLMDVIPNLNTDVIACDLLVCNKNKIEKMVYPDKIENSFLITNTLGHQATFIKHNLFKKYGLYDESYKIVSDWKKWLDFFVKNDCTYLHVNKFAAKFKLGGISSNDQDLNMQERRMVLDNYFSQEEIDEALNELNNNIQSIKYKFIEHIFSVKNTPDKTHKVITIFGIHIKIKKK